MSMWLVSVSVSGGREKAPAAFCRKAAVAEKGSTLDIWGDGKQTRSFCFVDDCVEGILRLMRSDYDKPINIGSDEISSMGGGFSVSRGADGKKDVKIKHIEGPEGVRGRNSENTLIKQVLGWAPGIKLEDGLRRTYDWVKEQCDIVLNSKGGSKVDLQKSTIVKQNVDELNDFNFDI